MKLFEMEGFLRGKCLPGDMKVNETNAEYLMRKFAELEARCAALGAEAHGFKRFFMFAINAAFDGCDLTGDQIQEVAKEFGLVRVEPYCAAKHAEMSGDPGVMEEGDDFYIANKTPATDAFLAEVRAQGVEALVLRLKTAARIARERDDLRVADALDGEACRAQMFADEFRQEAK